ncbi:MAG: tripartite tricarboxylate transporter substrate binding protein [SAR202 cluster bacterium]|nr:tripartite tricarboxylate transporter substrate binding protein [SAR202 cluster bacterium]|tara:strand:+ start:41 stop:967 length:927 start_codon:yes stop_codon:yes gene_type:complete
MKISYLRKGLLAIVAGAFVAVTAGSVQAGFPDKPVTFIVPYSPGGGSDQQARRLQPGLEKALGVKVRIVYKTGGGGAVGFGELWRSKNDGYTISNVVVPNIVITAKGKDVGFKPAKFKYIGMTARAVGALMVPKNSKYKSLKQFVADAKANPGKITVAGVGRTGKSNMDMLAAILKIKYQYVPVSGGVGKMIPMIVGNHVQAGMTASSHSVKHRAKLDTIAVAGPSAVGALPGVPNVNGWGYITTWGVMAPPGTPNDRVKILNAALLEATADPKLKAMVIKNGLTPMRQTTAEAAAYVGAACAKYGCQ